MARGPGLSTRFDDALVWAATLHRRQRKAKRAPYISHLLAVSAIVIEHGGSENEAIAALLHDAVEDGHTSGKAIKARFGAKVASTVLACSDDPALGALSWRERKEAYLVHVKDLESSAALVSGADKLDNVRGLVRAHRRDGEAMWEAREGGREARLWFYRAMVDTLETTGHVPMLVAELSDAVLELERRSQEAAAAAD